MIIAAAGMAAHLAGAMAAGTTLPVIGVPLPFYSAGGSSVMMLYICVGLVLSVYIHNTKKLFG